MVENPVVFGWSVSHLLALIQRQEFSGSIRGVKLTATTEADDTPEERKLVIKLDLIVVPYAVLAYWVKYLGPIPYLLFLDARN